MHKNIDLNNCKFSIKLILFTRYYNHDVKNKPLINCSIK